jgi:Sap, sulfolipid-1-addressing protein
MVPEAVNPEVIVLALASAIRPSGLAAVYALLETASPRRLLVAYFLAGFTWSALLGIVVVSVFHGAEFASGNSTFNAVVDIVAGAAALALAAGVGTGRMLSPTGERSVSEPSWVLRSLRSPSIAVAAGVGVATHLPGLFYVLALNSIVAQRPSLAEGTIEVLIYNAVWFSASGVSLLAFELRPAAARAAVARASAWAREHERAILLPLFAGVGTYFVVKGAVSLIG